MSIRSIAAAINAAVRVDGRPSTRRSPALADSSPAQRQRVRSGKMMLYVLKAVLDALTPSQIDEVAWRMEEAREAFPTRTRSASLDAYLVGTSIRDCADQRTSLVHDLEVTNLEAARARGPVELAGLSLIHI